MKRVGFIGSGNMMQAIVKGMLAAGYDSELIRASDLREDLLVKLKEELKITTTNDNRQVALYSDIIFIAVKPFYFKEVLKEIEDIIRLNSNKIIVSVAAGITIADIESILENAKIVRTMPNMPALVKEGMTAVTFNNQITEGDKSEVLQILNSFGSVEEITEADYHAFIGLCGSAPAYAFTFIETLGQVGIKYGIPSEKAYKMVAQTLYGSSKLFLESNLHPSKLRDQVCSPKGTTIEAVLALDGEFKSGLITAATACIEKSIRLEEDKK